MKATSLKMYLVKNMSFLAIFKILLMMFFIASPAQAGQKTIMVFGDSLVAGYGLPLEDSFPAQLKKKLKSDGHDVEVINAGVSGETSSGALARLNWSLQEKPDYFILVTGANDMLRATDPKLTKDNLRKILSMLKERKIPTLIAGMRSFRNLGEIIGGQYEEMYEDAAKEYGAISYPFFLDGVALEAKLNQQDGIHPNSQGVAIIVDKIYDDVEDLLGTKVE